jgi:glycine/D-amino acid oxidase-like deaminating enzyme
VSTHRVAEIVIAGAGIAGISAAYQLAVRAGVSRVVIVDPRPPLSLTSSKGTEAYRNYWPGPDDTMVRFMDRSIDLLDALDRESGQAFELNRRGYVFLRPIQEAERLRGTSPTAQFVEGERAIRARFPFVTDRVVAMLHAPRRFHERDDAGHWLLARPRAAGAELVHDASRRPGRRSPATRVGPARLRRTDRRARSSWPPAPCCRRTDRLGL